MLIWTLSYQYANISILQPCSHLVSNYLALRFWFISLNLQIHCDICSRSSPATCLLAMRIACIGPCIIIVQEKYHTDCVYLISCRK